MIFKNLYFNIIVRIILISATCILFPIAYLKYHDWIINANIIAFIIIQIALLIRKLNFTNRDLISFLDSIKYDDSSIILSNEYQNQDYFRLSKRLQKVNKQILYLKEQNLQKDLYFKTVTEHATVGLLSYDNKGSIKLCNSKLKYLFNTKSLSNISELNVFNKDLEIILQSIKPSEQKLIKVYINGEVAQLTIHATYYNSKLEKLKLVSIQDIKNELDEKELESWQKLVQILRHEIMNSIAPISSTIDTLSELITNTETNQAKKLDDLNDEMIYDIASGLQIIKDRNDGIQLFIDQFRSLSKIPTPKLEKINLQLFFSNIEKLWNSELKKKNISFHFTIDENIEFILVDKNQLEQVIINLIKNSIEAIEDNPKGEIKILISQTETNQVNIEITDNGKGIAKEEIEKVFLPFYTTKEQGSGIGLSLAKQIIRLHGGSISVNSVPKTGTSFTLKF
jgi:signal transduction histidine kinase